MLLILLRHIEVHWERVKTVQVLVSEKWASNQRDSASSCSSSLCAHRQSANYQPLMSRRCDKHQRRVKERGCTQVCVSGICLILMWSQCNDRQWWDNPVQQPCPLPHNSSRAHSRQAKWALQAKWQQLPQGTIKINCINSANCHFKFDVLTKGEKSTQYRLYLR